MAWGAARHTPQTDIHAITYPLLSLARSLARSLSVCKPFPSTCPHRAQAFTITVELFEGSSPVHQVLKRYSSMFSFFTKLQAEVGGLPPFPPKKWFGNLSSAFVEKRRAALDDYFIRLSHDVEVAAMPKVVEYLAETDSDILLRPGLIEPISPRSGRRVHGDVWAGPPTDEAQPQGGGEQQQQQQQQQRVLIRVGEGKIV